MRDEGPTNDDNLIDFCLTHHHLMHEGGWTLRGNPNDVIEFISPEGTVYEGHLPGLRDDVESRLAELFPKFFSPANESA